MGLDSVELVLEMEREFGIEIPDSAGEKMITVGNAFTYIRDTLAATPPIDCMIQKVFYKLRRAFIENYGLSRNSITPDSKLRDLLTLTQLEEGWPYLQMFIDLKTPEFVKSNMTMNKRLTSGNMTVSELAHALIDLNFEKLDLAQESDKQIWERLVDVVVRQANVNRDEVVPEAWFTRDLGID